jgi:hypothetical protein
VLEKEQVNQNEEKMNEEINKHFETFLETEHKLLDLLW